MKLVNLIPLKEIDFRNQDQFDDYQKQHSLRPDTKVTIAGKPQTVAQASKNSEPTKGCSIFGKDKGASVFAQAGGASSDTKKVEPKAEKSKYDDKEYWKDDEKSDSSGYYDSDDEDDDDDYDGYDDGDSWGEGPQFTSDRLNKVEAALEDDLNLRGNGFETTRESGGGGGGWEGPMTIVSKDADQESGNYISLSVGSPDNDGKFSIVFANDEGMPYFEPNYDALTGNNTLEPQQAFKITKALMKMPEVQKVLKGEMSIDEFQPIYDKLKSKFSKSSGLNESAIKLKSLIKRNK
jgi:hypothetical protein